jgi:hypothetical protein
MNYDKDLETLDLMLEQGLIDEEDYHETVAAMRVGRGLEETTVDTDVSDSIKRAGAAASEVSKVYKKAVSLREYQEGWEEIKKQFPPSSPAKVHDIAKGIFNTLGNSFYRSGQELIHGGFLVSTLAPKLKLNPTAFSIVAGEILKYMVSLGLIEYMKTQLEKFRIKEDLDWS